MRRCLKFFICLILSCIVTSAFARSPSLPGAQVYIISPVHGEVVTSPVLIRFGLRAMGVAPAGIDIKGTGHHHLLLNVTQLPELDKPIPADEQHIHYGKGQTETFLELPPGSHNLQLLFGDYLHIPHDPVVKSKPITIHVTE